MTDPPYKQSSSEVQIQIDSTASIDKERLEQKELDRKMQAHKDKISFSFSWIAIIVRGIVGTCISIFIFTQAHRFEDENSMDRFNLLVDYNIALIERQFNDLTNLLKDIGNLYVLTSAVSHRPFAYFIQETVKDNPFIHRIDWIDTKKQEEPLSKEGTTPTLTYTAPEDAVQALAGTLLKLSVPIVNRATHELLGYAVAEINLSKLIFNSIDPKSRYAMDIFVYSTNPDGNQLLYFFNAEPEVDRIAPETPKQLALGYFKTKQEIDLANQKFLLYYNATPEFTVHSWQAIIAASIAILITSFIVVTAWILLEIEKRQFSNVLHEEHIQEIEGTIDLLETTKNRLVAQENLASLGGLTAGIAHEIKNPLNFINNFSLLSIDIVTEIDKFICQHQNKGSAEEMNEIIDSLDTLKQNIQIIHEQGQRADSTIQRMLAHSRGKPGEWELTDMHKLLNEYLAFSFHGMRAKNSSFNVKIDKEFESEVKDVLAVTNDIGRVFLNLFNNAFQAIDEKAKRFGEHFQAPTLKVKTQNVGNYFRVRIRDNGTGITEENKAKIFTPFFTTKPTGVGTGLGLSLAYNIIVREHGGSLTFDSKEGEYTEFVVTIPLNRQH